MTPGKAILAAACCVVLVLVLVWLQRAERAEARERAEQQPAPRPLRFEPTPALDLEQVPAIEQLGLTQDERDAQVEGLYEWIGDLLGEAERANHKRADPAPREQP